MTALVWAAIVGGRAIVILAVGIPYLLTHTNMHDPYGTSEGQAYRQAKRRWHRRRPPRFRTGQSRQPGKHLWALAGPRGARIAGVRKLSA